MLQYRHVSWTFIASSLCENLAGSVTRVLCTPMTLHLQIYLLWPIKGVILLFPFCAVGSGLKGRSFGISKHFCTAVSDLSSTKHPMLSMSNKGIPWLYHCLSSSLSMACSFSGYLIIYLELTCNSRQFYPSYGLMKFLRQAQSMQNFPVYVVEHNLGFGLWQPNRHESLAIVEELQTFSGYVLDVSSPCFRACSARQESDSAAETSHKITGIDSLLFDVARRSRETFLSIRFTCPYPEYARGSDRARSCRSQHCSPGIRRWTGQHLTSFYAGVPGNDQNIIHLYLKDREEQLDKLLGVAMVSYASDRVVAYHDPPCGGRHPQRRLQILFHEVRGSVLFLLHTQATVTVKSQDSTHTSSTFLM